MMLEEIGFLPDTENEGWYFAVNKPRGFFGDIYGNMHCRIESDRKVRLRIHPTRGHCNQYLNIHGGFTLALIDSVISVGPLVLDIPGALGGVTVEVSTQFFNAMSPDQPIDAVFEVMRETGRMIFSRGVIEQNNEAAVAFSGITKKASTKK